MRKLVAIMTLSFALSAGAQNTPQTHPTPQPLWPAGAPMAQGTADVDTPTIAVYLPASNPTKTAVVIAPGGGYVHLSMQKEGEDIALWLNARGVAGIVLKYRLGSKYHHPVELNDAKRALRTVRSQAAALGISPDRIGIWGFSAGGHLAATAGTMSDPGDPAASDPIDRLSSRPDFMILAYPVITMDERYAYTGLRPNLLGEHPDLALVNALSPELHVTATTPPAFLFATTDDHTVPVMNSVLMYSALVAAKVSAEMHLYQHGAHGAGLAQSLPDLKSWPDLLATWMRAKGFMGPAI